MLGLHLWISCVGIITSTSEFEVRTMMTCSTHSGGPDGVTRTDQAENISTKMMPMTAEQRILAASRLSSLEAAPGFLRTQWAPLLIACYSCPSWAVGANLLFPLLSSRGPSCPRRKHGVWETEKTPPHSRLCGCCGQVSGRGSYQQNSWTPVPLAVQAHVPPFQGKRGTAEQPGWEGSQWDAHATIYR